jgi:hypothetical protein
LASSAVAAVHYVSVNNQVPTSPYATWPTAATNIQDAIDAAAPGDTVLVTNGVYQFGGYIVSGATNGGIITGSDSNRVAVTKPILLQSVNGPLQTVIVGRLGNTASDYERCVFLTNGAVLDGFTLTNGNSSRAGGGVWCCSTSSVVTNCVITGNSAQSSLYSFTHGGGAFSGTLNNCVITMNHARYLAGGAYQSTLNNCLLTYNIAAGGGGSDGGGAVSCVLNSCTVVSNTASVGGGGVENCTLNNCIIYDNLADFSQYGDNISSVDASMLNYCCTTPMPTNGVGNITNEPVFVDLIHGDFHLQPTSPCINSGNNSMAIGGTDLDGKPRISGGTLDLGAYEFQAQVTSTFADWLRQYGLPTDGSADDTDSDGTGMVNWQKWLAGLNPTNPASVLALLPPAFTNATGVTIAWQSVTNRNYTLQRGTSLTGPSPFTTLQNSLPGQIGVTSYTDTNATGSAPFFYRVGVQ